MSCSTWSPSSIRATTSRGPTRIRTTRAPVSRASQRAAMRVPLPESSAVDPSGFQITISAQSSPLAVTWRTPSASATDARTSSAVRSCSVSRYTLPWASQRENCIGHLVRGSVRRDANEPGDAPHPLPLVAGEAPGRLEERLGGCFAEVGDELEAHHLARRRRERAGDGGAHLVHDSCVEHRARARLDAAVELVRLDVEADDQRRVPRLLRPENVALRRQRRARLRELEGTHDPTAVVSVDALGGGGIAL